MMVMCVRGNRGRDVLKLDGAAGGDARERAAAGGGAAATRAADAQQLGDHADRAEDRHEAGQLTAHAADLGAELAAVRAVAEMTSRQSAGADAAVVGDDQVLADT